MQPRAKSITRAWLDSGDVWIWANASAVALAITALLALLTLIATRGLAHFWPANVTELEIVDNGKRQRIIGQLIDSETLTAAQYEEATGRVPAVAGQPVTRWLVKTGNRRIDPPDFRWVYEQNVVSRDTPAEISVLERREWGNAYGRIEALEIDQRRIIDAVAIRTALSNELARIAELNQRVDDIERQQMNPLNYELNQLRLERRRLELDPPPAGRAFEAQQALERQGFVLEEELAASEAELRALRAEAGNALLIVRTGSNSTLQVPAVQTVRVWQPNQMSIWTKMSHFAVSFWRFLSEYPREANTEGGVFPAIFGTILMVLLMRRTGDPARGNRCHLPDGVRRAGNHGAADQNRG